VAIIFSPYKTVKEDKMKILVGYEESRVADAALKLALKHARAFGADVLIVTSLEQGPALKKEDIDKAENRLERLYLNSYPPQPSPGAFF